MKNILKAFLCALSVVFVMSSCHHSKEKVTNLRFSDSLFVDTLMNFMLSENLVEIPEDINKVDYFQTYVGHDYLTDSTGNVFYVETESGTCGNTVCILDKTADKFKVLYTENCVEVNTDIEHNDVEGGYRVIYINKPDEDGLYKIRYNGTQFQTVLKDTTEDLASK